MVVINESVPFAQWVGKSIGGGGKNRSVPGGGDPSTPPTHATPAVPITPQHHPTPPLHIAPRWGAVGDIPSSRRSGPPALVGRV